jgi:hypothetical protein
MIPRVKAAAKRFDKELEVLTQIVSSGEPWTHPGLKGAALKIESDDGSRFARQGSNKHIGH